MVFFFYTGYIAMAKELGELVNTYLSHEQLIQNEIQKASFRIWIRIDDSISNDHNLYA